MRKSLTFNGIRKPWLYLLEGRSKSPFAPIRNNLLYVPGMPGAYVQSKDTGVLYITQPIGFIVKDDEHALQIKDELAEWLITDSAVELQFDDEPGRTYYAQIEGTIEDFQKFVDQRKGTITFLCADPYSYGPEVPYNFTSDTITIENKGTADSLPIFELEALKPTTFAMIQNQLEQYMMIGRPVDVDEVPFTRLTTILNDTCSSLVGWTSLPNGTTLDTGIVGGVMEVQGGYAFSAASYGTNPNGWVGPAVKKSLSESVQDFRVEMRIGAFNTHGDIGSIELHLLDANDNVVAILAMRDSTTGRPENRAVVQLGQSGNRYQFVNYNGGYVSTWNDFSGIVRLEREDNKFTAYVAVIDNNGNEIRRYTTPEPYLDSLGNYQAPIVQVMVYDAKAKEYTTYDKLMNNIYVGRINQEIGIPYIVDVGDIIQFNHVDKMVYINGEPRPDLKSFGGSFFGLVKGNNELIVHPSETFKVSLKYRERYR